MLLWNGDTRGRKEPNYLAQRCQYLTLPWSYIFNALAFATIMVHNTKPQNAVTETEVGFFPHRSESAGLVLLCTAALQLWVFPSCLSSSLVPLGSSGYILMVMAKAQQAASPTTWTLSKLIFALQLLTSFNPKQNTWRNPSQEAGTLIRGNAKL